jgi:tetratricopeptide (TPR) repeat protein
MNKVKTCVYAISLNEIDNVEKFVEASKEADLILVCDTGSTDGTPERLKELGVTVYNIKQSPWRFDIPRNTALNLVPHDIDVCLSIDLDEFLQPGWSTALDRVWQQHQGKIKRISYDYIWNWQSDGVTPGTRFFADKIHHRHGYMWKHPCHETLYWTGTDAELKVTIPEIVLHHRADNTKSRLQYLDLLKLAVTEDPNNDRMSHYYGRELMFRGQYKEAIVELTRHLSLSTAQWNEERASSLRFITRCQRFLGQSKESQITAMKAILECSYTREPWLELARSAYVNDDWATCYWATSKCLEITQRSSSYINEVESWSWEPYDLAATSAYFLGHYDKAKLYGAEALKFNPTDQRLQQNMQIYLQK